MNFDPFFDGPLLDHDNENIYGDTFKNKLLDKEDNGFLEFFLRRVERHPDEYEKEFMTVFDRMTEATFGIKRSNENKEVKDE